MSDFFRNFSFDGRYRFRRGQSIDPLEELHPEMADQEVEVGSGIPSTPEELIFMQENETNGIDLANRANKTTKITDKVQKVLDLINELETSPPEDQQIAITLVQRLEVFHDEVVNKMKANTMAKHSQIVAWAVDADRLYRSLSLLETIDLS